MTLLPLAWAIVLVGGAWSVRPRRVPLVVAPRSHVRAASLAPVAAALVAVLAPVPLVLLLGAGAATWWVRRDRHARRARRATIVRSLPEVVDLLQLAVGAGLTVPLAIETVARRSTGPLADDLVRCLGEVALGRRLADALDELPGRTHESVRPVVAALVSSDRYGAPLADALALLAAEVRADRRRLAEEAARKVPVKLLFPLVCCVLPAFGLLTVAPLIAGAAAALRL